MSQLSKTGLKGYLDNLVDEDGFRTELTITLTDRTLLKTSLYLVGTTLVSTLIIHLVKNLVK